MMVTRKVYDFYLYAVLAPFFAALFFPTGNDTAALLSAFAPDEIADATYAVGFLIRPFGALVFGRSLRCTAAKSVCGARSGARVEQTLW
jgi:hypothetical protein